MRHSKHDCVSPVNTYVFTKGANITNVKNTFAHRLKSAREEAGLTQAQLAKIAGFKTQSAVGNMEAGRPGTRHVTRLAAALGVEARWLAEGLGPKTQASNVGAYSAPARQVPIISWVRAGSFSDIDMLKEPTSDDWATTPFAGTLGPRGWALVAEGDSMDDGSREAIVSGSILFCDPDLAPAPNSYVIAKDVRTQQATFKKLTYDAGRWFLTPLNKQYQAIEIDDPSLRVIAVVVQFQPPARKLI